MLLLFIIFASFIVAGCVFFLAFSLPPSSWWWLLKLPNLKFYSFQFEVGKCELAG